ncbi:MAG: hypothetical protein QNJ89_13760 [Acidimicrobiia bacterium]|nr:hypothetical protein [Acidimicrobiia bacterium]
MDELLAPELLAHEVSGPGITPRSLGTVLGGGPTLLVFLRHFG